MKKGFLITLFFAFVFLTIGLGITSECFASDDSGTFRGKWWNYYDRGLAGAEKTDFENSINDLKKAISMRNRDQRMARTYGMHFIDYFPHRELGIVHFEMGDISRAISELEESIRGEESAKAVYYLNKARKTSLLKQKDRQLNPPSITVESPHDGAAVKNSSIKIKGKALSEGFISRISVNSSPYRFDMAKEGIGFEKDINLEDGENSIVVAAEDLLGRITQKAVSVIVDREGPSINIIDMVPEDRSGIKFIKVTGEINDRTGIKALIINDRILDIKNLKTYEFTFSVPSDPVPPMPFPPDADSKSLPWTGEGILEWQPSGKLMIQASDSLDNETRAEIDIEKEAAAFKKKPELLLMAFNGDRIFSLDKEPPQISLRDAQDIPSVFVDKYYVEGEAFDNKKIERILVNSKEVAAKKGRKIFFSKIVNLKEGRNRIVVDVFDGSNNKTTTEFNVTRNIPDVLQVSSRMSISVLPFESKLKTDNFSELAYEHLIGSFIEQKRFSIVERTKLEQVLLEQKLTKAKLTDPEHSIKVGRLMSANAILATSIKEGQKSLEIISRIINTETSEVMEVKDVFSEDKSLATVRELVEGLASKIALSFPVIEGMVINRDKGMLFTDIGNKAGIRKGIGAIIYRKGKEIKHPVTGKSLGWDTTKLGEGRIEDIQEDFSKIKLSDKPVPQEVAVKDLVITK